jgi:hypothetical protein
MTQIKMVAFYGSNLLVRPLKTTLLAETLCLNNRLVRRVSQQVSAISIQYQHHSNLLAHHSNLSVLSRHHKQ